VAAIDYASLQPGMQITASTDWTATGASTTISGTIVSVTDRCIIFDNGDSAPNPAWIGTDQTVSFDQTGGAALAPEPAINTIVLDETGAAWQRLVAGWYSINGDLTDWAGFLALHPTYTVQQDTPVTPLPDPVSPYPVAIAPGDTRLGMDIRVTVTYDDGGSRVVRGVCPWVQDNPPPDDPTPSFLCLPPIGGAAFIGSSEWAAAIPSNPDLQLIASDRIAIQYDPLPAGITVSVEQMQAWTADAVWDVSGIPEPPDGSVVRSKNGVAWQRTGTATEDGPIDEGATAPYYLAGQGMWSSVTGDYPRSFLWLWGAAAPFNVQQAAP